MSLNELFRMVQEGRRRLGLREYKSRWGLIFALRHNRVPYAWKNQRVKLYDAPAALSMLCPGADAGTIFSRTEGGEVWGTLTTVWRHANELRVRLGLRPLKRPESMSMTLKRKGVPRRRYGRRNYYYRLEEALQAVTRCENAGRGAPRHRVGTAEEVESGDYMPLTECARMLRCAHERLSSAAGTYDIAAFRHPHTNRIWVRIKDAERVAHYRSAGFLFRYLPEEEVHFIMRTRRHMDRWWEGMLVRRYYVPELAHLGVGRTSAEGVWCAEDVANAQKGSKNARGGKVASVPMKEGMPPCQVYAEVGKR